MTTQRDQMKEDAVSAKEKLRLRLQELKSQAKPVEITAVVEGERVNLSPAQARLWFLHTLLGPNAVYNMPLFLKVNAAISDGDLGACIKRLLQRHKTLRTRFCEENAFPKQYISADLPQLEFCTVDTRDELLNVCKDEANRGFDLTSEFLIRVRIVALDGTPARYVLLTLHHCIADAHSLGLLHSELNHIIAAHLSHGDIKLKPLPFQFIDYLRWKQNEEEMSKSQQALDQWKGMLTGMPDRLDLSYDYPPPSRQSYRGDAVMFSLPASLSKALLNFSQQQGTTLFVTLLAGFSVLLAKHARQYDFGIGTPVANRGEQGCDDLLGYLVNTLVIRVQPQPKQEFSQFLATVKAFCSRAFRHQDVALEKVVEAMHPERNLAHSPLFQVMFGLQQGGDGGLSAASATSNNADESYLQDLIAEESASGALLRPEVARFSLNLNMYFDGNVLQGVMEFACDQFRRDSVDLLCQQYKNLLDDILSAPDKIIEHLTLHNTKSAELAVTRHQKSKLEDKNFEALPLTVLEVAREYPDRVALIFEGAAYTYESIHNDVLLIQNKLLSRDIGVGKRVGVYLNRGPLLLPSLVAVLCTGAAYVPLDPSQPKSRIDKIIDDADIDLFICDAPNLPFFENLNIEDIRSETAAASHLPTLHFIDSQRTPISAFQLDGKRVAQTPQSLIALEDLQPQTPAYIMYTSGSTGQPKGVVICHNNVWNFLHSMAAILQLNDNERFLALTTFAFDISILELFLPLISASSLRLLSQEQMALAPCLIDVLEKEKITCMQATPASYKMLIAERWSPKARIRALVGGEALTRDIANELMARNIELWNMYGPTETCVWSACSQLENLPERSLAPSLGEPIHGTRLYVLDENLKPVAQCIMGELFIAGVGVAQGYYKNAALTAKCFVADPFGSLPGDRMYRSGDIVRLDSLGHLHFLGRRDQQVKIRGFRIELGEIEEQLRQHFAVQDAALVHRQGEADGLWAFIVPDISNVGEYQNWQVDEHAKLALLKDVMQFVEARLPSYMQPRAIVPLVSFPLNANAKVDRTALPQTLDIVVREAYEEPVGEIEKCLATLWKNFTGCEKVGRRDNFFRLGGHSLSAAQVVAAAKEILGQRILVADIFIAPNLQALAQRIALKSAMRDESHISMQDYISQQPRAEGERLPLSYSQKQLWFLSQYMGPNAVYNMPTALVLRGRVDVSLLRRAVLALIEKHTLLRSRYVTNEILNVDDNVSSLEDSVYMRKVASVPDIAIERVSTWSDLIEAFTFEQDFAFDLEKHLPWRLRLLTTESNGEECCVIVFNPHHSIFDAWSSSLFFSQLFTGYSALKKGIDLPQEAGPKYQYADYARWQTSLMDGERWRKSLSFWRNKLAHMPEYLDLPCDAARKGSPDFTGSSQSIMFDEDFSHTLRGFAKSHGTSLYTVLLSAFSILLFRYTNQNDFAIGTPVANRDDPATRDIIGYFVNTLVMRMQFEKDDTSDACLKRTHQLCQSCFEHQDLPFEYLIENLQVGRYADRNPLFQVLFALQNIDMPSGDNEEFYCDTLLPDDEYNTKISRFDISVNLSDSGSRIQGRIEFASQLFKADTIKIMMDNYQNILRSMVNGNQALSALPLAKRPAVEGAHHFLSPGVFANINKALSNRHAPGQAYCYPSSDIKPRRAKELNLASYTLFFEDVTQENDEAEISFNEKQLMHLLKDEGRRVALPRTLMSVPEIPRMISGDSTVGDIDLPALKAAMARETNPKRRVQGHTEEILASIWSRLLGHEVVFAEENFFNLGGYSLLATQLRNRVRDQFHCELTLKDIFQQQTLCEQARFIEKIQNASYTPVVLQRANRDLPQPLSSAQQRLWFLHQMIGANAIYNLAMALEIWGDVHLDKLQNSLRYLWGRHEALRTQFILQNSEVKQIVCESCLDTDVELFSSEHEIKSVIEQEQKYAFPLVDEPLSRLRILQLKSDANAEVKTYLSLNLHHAIADGWSMGLFFRELVETYVAQLDDKLPALAALHYQAIDYCQWQQSPASEAVYQSDLVYWRQQLDGLNGLLALPYDRPRPKEQSYSGLYKAWTLDAGLSDKAASIARQQGISLFMLLISAFAVLLSRYSGQRDLVIGTPLSLRDSIELESVMGFFINSVALRFQINHQTRFVDLLLQTRENCLAAIKHQNLPFERLVEELNPERNLSYPPVFQVSFSLLNTPMDERNAKGLVFRSLDLSGADNGAASLEATKCFARYDITFNLSATEAGIVGGMEFNSDLFDATSIARMLEHYENILTRCCNDVHTNLDHLNILSEKELWQQSVVYNRQDQQQQLADLKNKSLDQCFDAVCAKYPDVIAVSLQNVAISYEHLNKQANQLARFLLSRRFPSESRIGICMERGPKLATAIIAVVKAGMTYLPLDPLYPDERLKQMLNASQCALVLSEEDVLETVECLQDWPHLALDSRAQIKAIASLPANNIATESSGVALNHPQQLAYVMYTSGSTGRPKGSCIPHAGILRLVEGDWLKLGSFSRFLCAASFSFDAFTLEYWGPLLKGRTCVMMDLREHMENLGRALEQHAAECAWITSALFTQIVMRDPMQLSSLKTILTGGEALSMPAVMKAKRHLPETQLLNCYGPTENTTFSTTHPIDLAQLAPMQSVPIGRVISKSTVYIVDQCGQMCPKGVVGELLLGGLGIARAYEGQPGLSAERFIPNPFADEKCSGSRLYRSGDLARYRNDGVLEFIGRVDSQVKIRGYRIELSEIENVLSSHAQVKEAAVLAPEVEGQRQIVAYLSPMQTGDSVEIDDIQEHVRLSLPEYMCPSAFIVLDEFPLNENKKINRHALPKVSESDFLRQRFAAPETPLQSSLCELWQLSLGLDSIGLDDNYFSMGGDSIRSIALVSDAQDRGIMLSVKDIFQYPTIRALSTYIESMEEGHLKPHKASNETEKHIDKAFSLISEEELDSLLEDFDS